MKKFEDFFIILYYLHKSQGHTKLASKAEWYTLCRFAPQNRLLGEAPNPPEQIRTGAGCAFPWNACYRLLAY